MSNWPAWGASRGATERSYWRFAVRLLAFLVLCNSNMVLAQGFSLECNMTSKEYATVMPNGKVKKFDIAPETWIVELVDSQRATVYQKLYAQFANEFASKYSARITELKILLTALWRDTDPNLTFFDNGWTIDRITGDAYKYHKSGVRDGSVTYSNEYGNCEKSRFTNRRF